MKKLISYLQDKPLVAIAAMVVAAFFIYGGTLSHEFVLDDGLVISENVYVQEGVSGIPKVFMHSHTHGATEIEDNGYRPIPLTVYAIVNSISGNKAGAYHFLNVLLYGLSVGFFLLWLWKLKEQVPASLALMIALMFLVHPVHTEVVANIKGMEDVLIFLFLMLMLNFLHRYAEQQSLKHLALSLLIFALALITKETAVSFMALVPAYLFVVKPVKLKNLLTTTGAFVGVFAVVWTLRAMALSGAETAELSVLNNALVAVDGKADQLATAFWMQLKYLQLFFFPIELSSDYSFNQIAATGLFELRGIIAAASMLLLTGLTAYGVLKRKLWGFGLLVFAATMSVVSNTVVLIGATMAERFLFIPSAGLCLALLLVIEKLMPSAKKAWLTYALIPVLLLFVVKTTNRNKDWATTKTLIETDAKTADRSTRMQTSLAKMQYADALNAQTQQQHQQGLLEAKKHFEKSVEILPSNFDGWYNLGLVEEKLGQFERAIKAYEECVKHAPEFALAYNNMGVYYFNQGEQAKAAEYFLKAYEFGNGNANIVSNRGLVEHAKGDYREAIKYYEASLQIDPMLVNSLSNLVKSYRKLGDMEQAQYYQQRLTAAQGRL